MNEVIQDPALVHGSAPDLAASQAELQQQAIDAPQPEEVPETETQARVQQWGLAALAVGAMVWLIVSPQPNAPAVLAAGVIPWVAAMAACWSGGTLHVIRTNRADRSPHVTLAFTLPAVALMMCVTEQFHVVNWQRMVAVACVAGAAMGAAALLADQRVRRQISGCIAVLAVSGMWGFGAGLGVDAALDGSPATVYRTAVMGHHVSHGRHTSYYLTLAPWGPRTENDAVEVPWKTYAAIEVGDEVCVPMRPGALGVTWYRVERCQ